MDIVSRLTKPVRRRAALTLFRNAYPPGHFYSPVPRLADTRKSSRSEKRPEQQLLGIAAQVERQVELFDELRGISSDDPWSGGGEGRRYTFDNEFFGSGDALVLHALLRKLKPARVVEVGSGYSSACMLDTAEHCLEYEPDFVFIDPYPSRLRGLLSPSDRATVHECTVQDVDASVFSALGKNDILFIDSSHVSKFQSDVNYLVFEVLPILAEGVWVHFHDIHFPFEYPTEWLQAGRAWNEAYLLRAFLMFNEHFTIEFWNGYLDALAGPSLSAWPQWQANPGGSIWLKRN